MNVFSIWPALSLFLKQKVDSHEPFVLLDSWVEDEGSPHTQSILGLHPKKIFCEPPSNAGRGLALLRGSESEWGMGVIGYESHHARFGLDVPKDGDPQLWWMLPATVLKFDLQTQSIEIIQDEQGRADEVVEYISRQKHQHQEENLIIHSNHWTSIEYKDYLKCIEGIHKAIYEGESYEVNFTYPMKASYHGNPIEWGVSLLEKARVPFSAMIHAVETPGQLSELDRVILSGSPERFLNIQGTTITSEPIKGTIRRDEQMTDQELREALKELDSDKNRAENLMIVDLVRHDFHSICEPGSVVVPELFKKRSFGTVHQLISTIQGTLKEGTNWLNAFEACFPMGSMTGAPKRAAMHLIDQFEVEPRGIYSGAIGYSTPEGNADFNVVIRTAILDLQAQQIRYHVGGAITSDSNAESEWEETKVKAQLVEGL
mgnify:FL=1